jgi:hypothetical protein
MSLACGIQTGVVDCVAELGPCPSDEGAAHATHSTGKAANTAATFRPRPHQPTHIEVMIRSPQRLVNHQGGFDRLMVEPVEARLHRERLLPLGPPGL